MQSCVDDPAVGGYKFLTRIKVIKKNKSALISQIKGGPDRAFDKIGGAVILILTFNLASQTPHIHHLTQFIPNGVVGGSHRLDLGTKGPQSDQDSNQGP